MQKSNFIEELNGLKSLLDRFDLLHNSYSVILDGSDAETFHLVDYKVLCIGQSYALMDKNYRPFVLRESFTEDERLFLEQHRIGHIKEPLLEAYYCDVYSNAQNKSNAKYADILIDNYLNVVSNLENYKPSDVSWVMKSLVYNCKTYRKQRKEQVLEAIDRFLASDLSLTYKFRLLVNAYNYDFLKAPQVVLCAENHKLVDAISESYVDNEKFFKLLRDSAPKSDKKKIRIINQRLAENEDTIISQSPLNSSILSNLLKKCQYLESAGLLKEAEETFKQYIIAKTSSEGIVTVNMSIEIPNSFFQDRINTIITSPYPLVTLAEDDSLLPPECVTQNGLLSDLKELGTRLSYVDVNGNSHLGNGFYSDKLFNIPYNGFYDLTTVQPIIHSLKNLIEQGTFSEAELFRYLSLTWLNLPRLTVNTDLRKTQESWIDSLRPSIHSLCREITSEILSEGNYHGVYMSAIDSMAVKIEGCLREACRRLGINTVNPESNDEVTLEKIFQKIEAYQTEHNTSVISSSSLNLLVDIFTKKGLNLRNGIAHGLTSSSDYNINIAITVLHCLLKVSTMKV